LAQVFSSNQGASPGNYRMGLMLLEGICSDYFRSHICIRASSAFSYLSGLAYLFGGHFQRICITGVCFYWGPLVTLNGKMSFLSDEVMRKSWQSVHSGYGFYLPSGLSAESAAVRTGSGVSGQRIIQTVQVLLCTPLLLLCLASHSAPSMACVGVYTAVSCPTTV
jgi:hypothetical protein